MSIIAKDASAPTQRTFIPTPEGVCRAVTVDVIDIGEIEKRFPGKPMKLVHEVKLVWEVEHLMEDARRFIISRRFTLSLNKKASLRKFLETWRGRGFNDQELAGFDLEKLIGVCAFLCVQHEHGTSLDGVPTVYAKVSCATKIPPGIEPIAISGGYTRVQDREASRVQLVA